MDRENTQAAWDLYDQAMDQLNNAYDHLSAVADPEASELHKLIGILNDSIIQLKQFKEMYK